MKCFLGTTLFCNYLITLLQAEMLDDLMLDLLLCLLFSPHVNRKNKPFYNAVSALVAPKGKKSYLDFKLRLLAGGST